MQSSESQNNSPVKSLNDYVGLIETVARIEYSRLAYLSHAIDFSELVNIGAMAIHIILSTHKNTEYNSSYLSTAIRWAIRNELRRRYKWYSLRHQKEKIEDEENPPSEEIEVDQEQIREAIYETILSLDDLAGAENPTQIKDKSFTPEESLEFTELSRAIRACIKCLPVREKMILENRFFKGKKIKEIANELKISSSRVSRIIQSGLDKIRAELQKQELV
ncbi:MAG: sigma-70 family RNA polymerase sigma factor [Candidatus Gastranaerophilales bacterium]|nr:sigma-70 family RNA polymerase sigma factor [Candidatus Gastranaerophilales bacterium]